MNIEQITLPEGWALEEHESTKGPDALKRDGRTVAVITLAENYQVPSAAGRYNADRWFWDPTPQDFGHVGRVGGYSDYYEALRAALAYAQKREA